MSPTTLGMILGTLLIISAIVIFFMRKEFSKEGVLVVFGGIVLVGMSGWSSIRVSALGVDVEALQKRVDSTVQSVTQVAAQTDSAAVAVDTTKNQLSALARELADSDALSKEESARIIGALARAPRADRVMLRSAAVKLVPAGTEPVRQE